MSPSADLEALRAVLDADGVSEEPTASVDGLELAATLAPADGEALARALDLARERKLALIVRGGGSRLAFGNPPDRADLLLSTERLVGTEVFDAEDGVARVRAGTSLRALRGEANALGWELPLDPPGEATTVGGAIAAAAVGPRWQGFGPVRDCVLGLDVALASGERTRCGGRVVKNVTGYDLAKLYTGSFGTLGVIEAAWLRMRPLPERVSAYTAVLEPQALSLGLLVARRTCTRAAALLSPAIARDVASANIPETGWLLVTELAGAEEAVERDARWIHSELGASECHGGEIVARLRAAQAAPAPAGGLRARIAALSGGIAACCASLRTDGADLIVHPGSGLVYAWPSAQRSSLDLALASVDAATAASGGSCRLEDLPAAAKRGRDVFGDAGAALPLMRALKQRFDPDGVLNPGRFAGGI